MGQQAVPPPPGGGHTGVQTSHRSGRPPLVPVKTMAWIGRKAEKIARRTADGMLKLVRNKHTNRPHTHLDRPRGQAGLQAHPRYRRGRGLNRRYRRYTIIRYHTPSCPAPRQPRPAPGCSRPAQADPHAHQAPSGNSQKTAKPASPRFAGHTPQPMPGCFPHASDPHTGHILTQPQSDYAPAETSGRSPQIPNQYSHSSSLGRRQAWADPRIQPTHSNSNVQRLGGMGDDDAASTSTTTGGGGSTCVSPA